MPRGTPEQRDQVARLHAAGETRNDIARKTGISAGQVTAIARELGLSFDRSSTKAATEAKKADLAARRAVLQSQLLDDAARLRGQLWRPHTYIDHGGKDFNRVEWTQTEPTPNDKLKLMQAAGVAIDRSLKLDLHDSAANAAVVVGLLQQTAAALGLTDAADAGG